MKHWFEKLNLKQNDSAMNELFNMADNTEDPEPWDYNPIYQDLNDLSEPYGDLHFIAKGGVKEIYKAFDKRTKRSVAMAILKPDAPQEWFDPFIREARLTANLDHPNIITIHEIGISANKKPFFTMELKVGDSLGEILKKIKAKESEYVEKYNLPTLLNIFIKICDAIAYAHSKNILHLDLKPSNIQVGEFGEVQVCDWGLGKHIGEQENGLPDQDLINHDLINHLTLTGSIKGTPGYMAPEQIVPNELKCPSTDIFALGCMLYEIACLQNPLSHLDPSDLINRIKRSDLSLFNKIYYPKTLPLSIAAVIKKATSQKKNQRYVNVKSLQNEIQYYLQGFSTRAEKKHFFKELNLFYKRNRGVCNSIAISCMLLVSCVGFFFYKLEKSRLQEKETRIMSNEILHLYLNEQKQMDDFIKGDLQSIQSYIYMLTDNAIFHNPEQSIMKALNYLNQLIQDEPQFEWAYLQRGYLYFHLQNYVEAYRDLNKFPENKQFDYIRNLSAKYRNEEQPIRILRVPELIEDLGKELKKSNLAMLILCDHIVRGNTADHTKVVQETLQYFNQSWNGEKNFQYNSEEKILSLKGEITRIGFNSKGFNLVKSPTYKSFISLLKTLKIQNLDLSHSLIIDLQSIEQLKIQSLNFSHTKITNLQPILENPYLEKVIVHRGQFGEFKMNKLKQKLEVEIL
tara:strand:+ start:5860 stop:7911 length:2052 start_codon:yes stop_codon:yes gene_type:complete